MLSSYQPALLVIDAQNDFCPHHYKVSLVSDEKKLEELKPENKKVHVAIVGNSLKYKANYPEGVLNEGTITSADLSNSPIDQQSIKKLFPDILRILAHKGHIPGALAVNEGDKIMPKINNLMTFFKKEPEGYVVATKDWHPKDHMSFASNNPGCKPYQVLNRQTLWPNHCVQNSPGSQFHSDLRADLIDETVFKGEEVEIDSYSGFFDNEHKNPTKLNDTLENISHLFVVGLATDYCVKYSVLDALKLKYKEVYCIEDACRGVNLNKGDVEAALEEMHVSGAHIIQSAWVPLIDKVHREAAKSAEKPPEAPAYFVTHIRACDQSIRALKSTVNDLFGTESTMDIATKANILLLEPLLRAWESVLRKPDSQISWGNFIEKCDEAVKFAKSDLFTSKGLLNKFFQKGLQKALVNEVQKILESAQELKNFTSRFIPSLKVDLLKAPVKN